MFVYMLSGIASSVVCSPTVRRLKHDSCSLASPGTKVCDAVGGAFRPRWRDWPVSGRFRLTLSA